MNKCFQPQESVRCSHNRSDPCAKMRVPLRTVGKQTKHTHKNETVPHVLAAHLDGGSSELSPLVEEQLDVLAEPRGVVVANGPRVPESFQDGIRLQHPVLDGAELVGIACGVAKNSQVLENDKRGGNTAAGMGW